VCNTSERNKYQLFLLLLCIEKSVFLSFLLIKTSFINFGTSPANGPNYVYNLVMLLDTWGMWYVWYHGETLLYTCKKYWYM